MSRYGTKIDNSGSKIEYGYDRVPYGGYFYQVFNENGELVEGGDTRSLMVAHENEEHMNRSEIAEKLEEHGVNEIHVETVEMDQPL